MKILIDVPNVDAIRQPLEYYPVDGVNLDMPVERGILKEIRDVIGEDSELHVPIDSFRAEEIVDEARQLVADFGVSTYVKIPATAEGFKAMRLLNLSEVSFTASGVRTSMQALIAGKCGATYVMPFVNRFNSNNAVAAVKRMRDALNRNEFETGIIAARFHTSHQAIELCEYGVDGVSVSIEMLPSLIANDYDVDKVY